MLVAIWLGGAPVGADAPSAGDIKSVENAVRRAAEMYRRQDHAKAQELIRRCERRIANWTATSDPTLNARVQRLRGVLQRASQVVQSSPNKQTKPATKTQSNDVAETSRGERLFSRDIAPLIAARCLACHNDQERSSGLSLASYASMMAGGSSGELIDSGPIESTLLIGKLRGTADGEAMPLDDRPFTESEIAVFETWIRQGLKNDVGDRTSVAELATRQKLKHASKDELNQEREREAIKNWNLAFPGTGYEQHTTEDFLVIGTASTEALAEWSAAAEATWKQIQDLLAIPNSTEISQARVTLFIVDSTYALNEFSVMVTSRALTRPYDEILWSTRGVDAFVVIRAQSGPESVAGSLGRGLTGVWLKQAPKIPAWLVTGTANAVQIRIAPADRRVQRLDAAMLQVSSNLKNPADFMSQSTTREVTTTAATSFVRFLMQDRSPFAKLLVDLTSQGDAFDAAFQDCYDRDVESCLNDWWSSIQRGGRRR